MSLESTLLGRTPTHQAEWPQVLFINLTRSLDRRAAFESAAAFHKITVCRVEGVDGRVVPRERWHDVDVETFRHINGRTLLSGEYGCYRSHILALEQLIDSELPYAIIAEDDIVLDAQGMNRAASIIRAHPHFGIVKLVNHRGPFLIETALTDSGDQLGRTVHGPQGSAAAYLVSREAAIRLVKNIRSMSRPYDVALERFWHHGVDVLTVKNNLFAFAPSRRASTITSTAEAHDGKFRKIRRLGSYWNTVVEIGRRFHAVLKPQQGSRAPFQPRPSQFAEYSMTIALLAMASVFWLETDLYRYALAASIAPALVVYFRHTVWREDRPVIGWAGFACLGWAAYVAMTIWSAAAQGSSGSSEGIYLLPGLYSSLGFAIYLWFGRPWLLIAPFMGLSALALVIGTDYAALLDPLQRAGTWMHNNTIHASLAAGFLTIASACLLVHLSEAHSLTRGQRAAAASVSVTVLLLALLNVYLLNSKGVWLSLTIALPTLLLFSMSGTSVRRGLPVAVGVVILSLGAAFLGSDRIWAIAGETFVSSIDMVTRILSGEGVTATMDQMIADPATPPNSRERLMIWASVLRLWQEAPLFGYGPLWREAWADSYYPTRYMTLIHNGYLEIALRYGLIGLSFYAGLSAWACTVVSKAYRNHIIPRSVLMCFWVSSVYFAISLLTNSNNRLAIGESFMLLAFGFAFWCQFQLQVHGLASRRTYF